ncbi:hypothetical protein AWB67_07632 [Caballeronia terrestris]|uniref:Uncharacterized protein n=1 Tax=Caballeronia terrestris TaxID=1226301 RepID=A0A158L5Q6_9BURK|nr:hypothetical protein AWB67_07632 [Caballeronia terrestris]
MKWPHAVVGLHREIGALILLHFPPCHELRSHVLAPSCDVLAAPVIGRKFIERFEAQRNALRRLHPHLGDAEHVKRKSRRRPVAVAKRRPELLACELTHVAGVGAHQQVELRDEFCGRKRVHHAGFQIEEFDDVVDRLAKRIALPDRYHRDAARAKFHQLSACGRIVMNVQRLKLDTLVRQKLFRAQARRTSRLPEYLDARGRQCLGHCLSPG